MNYTELVRKVNNINVNDQKQITKIIEEISVNKENFNHWV